MRDQSAILIAGDDGYVRRAIARQLAEWDLRFHFVSEASPPDEVVAAAFGRRAIIAIGDRWLKSPGLMAAAEMPGVRSVVFIVHRVPDMADLKKRGIPYSVLWAAPLTEEVVDPLLPAVERGSVLVAADADRPVVHVAAEDVAECAIAAIDHDGSCGRLLCVASPTTPKLSSFAEQIAKGMECSLNVSVWPRWAVAASRALGRPTLSLPEGSSIEFSADDLSWLHPGPWRSVEDVAADLTRRNDHAVGM